MKLEKSAMLIVYRFAYNSEKMLQSPNETSFKESFSCKWGFSLLNFERGLKKTMGCLILKLYVVIILY